MTIQRDLALYFARRLRAARAQVQADAEGYVAVAIAIEQLGAALGAEKSGMGAVEEVIVEELFPSGCDWTHGDNGSPPLCVAYDRVRRARNIAVHEGAMSRAVAAHAIDLTIGLEVALMKAVDTDAARDWMVPNPTVAHPWMTVAQVRSTLLAGGFSALPIRWEDTKDKGSWHLVRDIDVVAYLIQAEKDVAAAKGKAKDEAKDKAKGKAQLKASVAPGAKPRLHLHRQPKPLVISPDTDVKALDTASWKSEALALVVCGSNDKHLLGVLTPHDLLTR